MAKPIEIRLVLEGEDARRFHKYMEDPKITKEGRNRIREAIKIAKKENSLPYIIFKPLDAFDDVSSFHSTEQDLDDFLKEDALK